MAKNIWLELIRKPDYVLDGRAPLLLRWHLLRPRRRFNVYLHKILRTDDCPELHHHPWWNVSIVLRGSYKEFREDRPPKVHRAGSIIVRRASTRHRLEVEHGPVWTIFVTGAQQRH